MQLSAPQPDVRDDIVALRLLTTDDAPSFLEGLRQRDIAQFAYSGRLPADEATIDAFLARVPARLAENNALLLAIVDANDGAFLGSTILRHVDLDERRAEVGFWLLPQARGRGAATSALRLNCAWAIGLGFERLEALTELENVGAQRTLERAGFTREGVLRGHERGPDGRVDLLSYSLLHDDPAAAGLR